MRKVTLQLYVDRGRDRHDHLKRMIHLEESVHDKIDDFMTRRLEDLGVLAMAALMQINIPL